MCGVVYANVTSTLVKPLRKCISSHLQNPLKDF